MHKENLTPMADYVYLKCGTDGDERIDAFEYSRAVESLKYTMIFIGPDLAFVPRKLSQSVKDHIILYAQTLKKILCLI